MRLIDADKLNLWTAIRPYCSSDVCCEVTNIIDNAPTVNPYEWISVEDKLPEETDDYIVVVRYPSGANISTKRSYSKERGWYGVSSDHYYKETAVTHWMSFPTPPIEKEN